MADDSKPRARDVALEAGLRQWQIAGDTEAARQQILASTLRLAGHVVSLNQGASASRGTVAISGAPAQPEDAAQIENISQPDETVPPDDTALPDDVSLPDPSPVGDGAARPDATLPAEDTSRSDESPLSDDALQFDDTIQPDGAQQDESDPSGDLPFDDNPTPPSDSDSDSVAGDSTLDIEPEGWVSAVEWLGPQPRPKSLGVPDPIDDDASDMSVDPGFFHGPASPTAPGSDRSGGDPKFRLLPEYYGSAGDWLAPRPGPKPFEFPGLPADGGGGSMSTGNPPTVKTLPDFSIFSEGDSASLHRPPAPGIQPLYPSPGAGSLSDPPSEGNDTGSADGGGGGRVLLPEAVDGTPAPDGASSGTDDRLSVEVMPIRSDEIQTEVMHKVTAMIEANVGRQIDQLRHETFVSRAAWNAALPR